MFKKAMTESNSKILRDAAQQVAEQSSVVRLGSATKLTLGRPGKRNKDGKYFYTK